MDGNEHLQQPQHRDPNVVGDDLLRVMRRPWRIAFVIYAIILTIATHWPKLQLPEQAPATDKSLHALAFGLGTWLLWRTAWSRTLWLVLFIALVWASADEITQMIPGLNRWVAWADFTANVCGVITAGVWIWIMRPIGGHANRRRHARALHLFDDITANRMVIASAVGITLLHIAIGAVAWVSATPGVTRLTIIVLMFTLPGSLIGMLVYHWPRCAKRIARDRPCFVCARLHRGMWSHGVRHRCADCGCMLDEDQWKPPAMREADRPVAQRLQIAVAAGAVLVAMFALMLIVPDIGALIGGVPLVGSGAIESMITLTVLLALLAAGVYYVRLRLARLYDAHLSCRHCGHDLRGIITTGTGVGKCSECNTLFRMRDF